MAVSILFFIFMIASANKSEIFVVVLILMVVWQLQYTDIFSHLLDKLTSWFELDAGGNIFTCQGEERREMHIEGTGGKGNYNLSDKSPRI